MSSKKKLAKNQCAASIPSTTATTGHRPEVFPVSHDRRTNLIATSGFKSEITCAVLFHTPSSSPSLPRRRDRLSLTHLFSAKGATFTASLGQRPRIRGKLKHPSAESAIHHRARIFQEERGSLQARHRFRVALCVGLKTSQRDESRFQRFSTGTEFLGRCPRLR